MGLRPTLFIFFCFWLFNHDIPAPLNEFPEFFVGLSFFPNRALDMLDFFLEKPNFFFLSVKHLEEEAHAPTIFPVQAIHMNCNLIFP